MMPISKESEYRYTSCTHHHAMSLVISSIRRSHASGNVCSADILSEVEQKTLL